jgi:inosine-uridine nucleoside N-ribohydrolase
MRATRCAALALVSGLVAPFASAPDVGHQSAVWIDTDPAVGVKARDVDDGLALLQAFHSPELAVRGVSVVFGNTSLSRAWPIGRTIVRRFGPAGLHAHRGARRASDLGVETPASRALATALEREPLVVIALGPATNIATVLKKHPAAASRMTRIVAVAGRRRGQRFTTGTVNRLGHRDFNFEQDPEAFRVILASGVPLTLAPFEISSKVWITGEDLDRLAQGPAGARWMAAPARRWLSLWKQTFNVDGFNPFDTLAVARVTSPSLLTCETLPARIDVLPDDATELRMQGTTVASKPYLLVSREFSGSEPTVEYCYEAASAFKADLLTRVLAVNVARPGSP